MKLANKYVLLPFARYKRLVKGKEENTDSLDINELNNPKNNKEIDNTTNEITNLENNKEVKSSTTPITHKEDFPEKVPTRPPGIRNKRKRQNKKHKVNLKWESLK